MSIPSRFIRIFDEFPLVPFQMSDLPSLVKLERGVFPVDYWTQANFLEELSLDHQCLQVIRANDKVIGYVHSEIRKVHSKNGRVQLIGEIGSIAVDKKYRGKKLGEKLFTFGVKRLKSLKADRIIINTRLDNHPMKSLAEAKFGFEVNRIIQNLYDDGAGAYEMVLA